MENISAKLKVKMPKEPVYYQVLGIKPDPNNKNRMKIPASVHIKNIQTIYDPGDEEVKTVKYVTGQRTTNDANGNAKIVERLGEIFFERATNGMITINPKNKKDLPLYRFLEICNENLSNPNRDKTVTPRFRKLDKAKEAKDQFEIARQRTEAVSLALNMPYEELQRFAEELNVPTNRDPYEVRMAMKVKAEQNPAIFIAHSKADVKTVITGQIKEAIDKEIIAFDEESDKWVWAQNKALILELKPGKEKLEALFEYYTGSPKGQAAFKKVLEKL